MEVRYVLLWRIGREPSRPKWAKTGGYAVSFISTHITITTGTPSQKTSPTAHPNALQATQPHYLAQGISMPS